jgi:hypothetical protein
LALFLFSAVLCKRDTVHWPGPNGRRQFFWNCASYISINLGEIYKVRFIPSEAPLPSFLSRVVYAANCEDNPWI